MSDAIPDDIPRDLYLKAQHIHIRYCNAELTDVQCVTEHARALMAAAKEADEAATKRVIGFIDKQAKEHSAQLARYRRDGETTGAFGQGEAILALSELRAAILKGEA